MKTIKTVLDHAEKQCLKSGTRLTEKRRQLLGQLLASGKAMSAYELADNFAKKFQEKISPMSVYRILDILRKANLVHKLNLSKKYIACAHITCEHSHAIPQFLICRQCDKVSEISIQKETIGEIGEQVKLANFQLQNPQLELHCICNDCQT